MKPQNFTPKRHLRKKRLYIALGIVVLIILIIVGSRWLNTEIEIDKSTGDANLLAQFDNNTLCDNVTQRPIAVMLSSDKVARHLSGVSAADIVFEMPVTDGGVTRMMAVFRCDQPEVIGSIRSSRLDFIPLVQGMDAIYAHWGGESQALAQLNQGATDNVDALKYEGSVFYRVNGVAAPHDGFSSFQRVLNKAIALGYRTTADPEREYRFEDGKSEGTIEPPDVYEGQFKVGWLYDPTTNNYERYRANLRERDENTGEPTFVDNVVHMQTTWSPIDINYIRVTTVGNGPATIYKNGTKIVGTWNKPTASAPLKFYDENEDEIIFTKGQIWINIVTNL